ncbi:MAG: phosphotransferase [Candidatus Pacebacteria bacterium]|nr:phosphotransferase [Candidatus Paceibacterota bacterium]
MIPLIHKVIRQESLALESAREPFSFLKYSTPNSGKRFDDKVIFLVFGSGADEPFLCVKTVRSYQAKDVVIRNYENLKKLNQLAEGSAYAGLFATARHLFDDGEQIFSIETACSGRRLKLDEEMLRHIASTYAKFHTHLAKNAPPVDLLRFAEGIVDASGFGADDQEKLLAHIKSLSSLAVSLPRIMQHGDLTEDNILISDRGFQIVDCDFIGTTDLPGFDLFGLFRRHNPKQAKELSRRYLPDYFKSVGATVPPEEYETLFFLYYLIERLRKSASGRGQTVAGIVADYESSLV